MTQNSQELWLAGWTLRPHPKHSVKSCLSKPGCPHSVVGGSNTSKQSSLKQRGIPNTLIAGERGGQHFQCHSKEEREFLQKFTALCSVTLFPRTPYYLLKDWAQIIRKSGKANVLILKIRKQRPIKVTCPRSHRQRLKARYPLFGGPLHFLL